MIVKKKLQDVADHLLGPSHSATVERKRIEVLWGSRDERHPWIKVLKATNPVVVRTLIKLAVDAYHDSKNLTLAAWS